MLRLALVTLVVGDYDEAIAYYTGVLGFRLQEDTDLGGGKRWVVVAPPGHSQNGAALLLAKAAGEHQASRVGDQTGGRVAFFLQTDDFDQEYARLARAGVEFTEEPRTETYGQVVVFRDLYGNRWDLLQLR
ncbi:VOC family protein [Flindersiella endophytica]